MADRAHSVLEPVRIVADGYDAIAERYLAWSSTAPVRLRYLERLLDLLPATSDVLELGCGAGEPHSSAGGAASARGGRRVPAAAGAGGWLPAPQAHLMLADILDLAFAPDSFDAVVAFYSLTHVPRAHHADRRARIEAWVRPGGVVLLSHGRLGQSGLGR